MKLAKGRVQWRVLVVSLALILRILLLLSSLSLTVKDGLRIPKY